MATKWLHRPKSRRRCGEIVLRRPNGRRTLFLARCGLRAAWSWRLSRLFVAHRCDEHKAWHDLLAAGTAAEIWRRFPKNFSSPA